jgi:hypothetical protein
MDTLLLVKYFSLGRTPVLDNHPEEQMAKGDGGSPGNDHDGQIYQNCLDQIHD